MKKIAKNQNVIMILFMIVIMLIIFITPNNIYATINPGDYEPDGIKASDVTTIQKLANPIIGTIKTVGIIVAVVTLGVLGVKYMAGSVSEKAEYKKTMIPYLIGAIMAVAITQLLSILIELITNIE